MLSSVEHEKKLRPDFIFEIQLYYEMILEMLILLHPDSSQITKGHLINAYCIGKVKESFLFHLLPCYSRQSSR